MNRSPLSRRQWMLQGATVAGGLAAVAGRSPLAAAQEGEVQRKGNIKHSLVHWCFKSAWNIEAMVQMARQLGCQSIELIPQQHWKLLQKNGLTVAIASSHPFREGFNDPRQWDACTQRLREVIDDCAAFGIRRVITFTGFAEGIDPDQGARNFVQGIKPVIAHAEKNNVTVCLEMLNTRDASHPMKGHPGYQGDHTDYCVDIIRKVGSEHLKLLFDVYHVQIMDGDVIRRIGEIKDYIGHVHTAGNPGRGELDDNQEIHYPAIMKALVQSGYDGFVGHEFIPTRDPEKGLRQAIEWCDV